MTQGVGLSVGAGNLTAVAVGRAAVRRAAVLTKFTHRPSEVGVPSENPKLDERGLVITDFVDRVGDPIGLLAPDGSSHRADALLADGLRAMFHTVARQGSGPVGVSYPAHWRPPAVDALRRALSTMPEFGAPNPVLLTPDSVAALTAAQQDPGVPARGVIALCDFGSTGTSITLADAARDFAPVAPTQRHLDLSGDLIDQALLTHVIGGLSSAGTVDLTGTSAIGSLSRLRAQCRAAKERLSTTAATTVSADLPGHRGEIRLTRTELDDAIRKPLAGFIEELQDILQRSGVRPTDLVAVATAGGGARIPIITTTLSKNLRVPVITTAHPELAAAIGAGLRAVRGTVVEGATAMAPAAPAAAAATGLAPAAPAPSAAPGPVGGLAWSDAGDDIPEVAAPSVDEPPVDGWDSARPQIEFAAPEEPDEEPAPWYRSPLVMMAGGLAVVLAAIAAAAVFLVGGDEPASTITTTTNPTATTTTATSSAPPVPAPEAPAPAPPSEPAVVNPPRRTVTVTEDEPPPPAPPAPTVTETPPPPPAEPPPPPPPSSPPPSSPPPLIPTLPYETIPGLPFVPSPFQPPQS